MAPASAVKVGSNGRYLRFAFVDITPELARQWLERVRANNRRPAPTRLRDYAATMKAGLWNSLTGECIKFDTTGHILDGQHRLLAIIEAKRTIAMLVAWNVPPEAFHTLDQGWMRSRLWWEGKDVASTVQMMVKVVDGELFTHRVNAVALHEMVERHRPAIRFSCDLFASKQRGIATATTRAIVARATYHAGAEMLSEFASGLYARSLPSTENRQFIVNKLLNYLFSGPTTAGVQGVRYRKTERALKAFINDEPIVKLYEASGEMFPLPEEVSP
jgi:hypothetical protein